MSFDKFEILSPKEVLIHEIEERIIRGKLSVGEKLPTERELEAQTGVSKSVVHFALIELERRGFLTIIPRRGVYVADFAKTGSAETLNEILRYNGGKLSVKMSIEIVELRNAIEGGALIRLAAEHTDEDLVRLRAALAEMKDEKTRELEIPEIAEMESRFHYLICELSGNEMFSLVMNSFSTISGVLWQYCAMFWGIDGFIEHDEMLIGMVERGEGHEAQKYIEDIFAVFLDAYTKLL